MKKIFIYTHSCDRRGLDANKTIQFLTENNYKIVDNPKDADIIIFFACAALKSITDKSLKLIKKFQKYNAELIVAGCLPAIEKEQLVEIFDGKTIITRDIERIDDIFPENKIKYHDIADANFVFHNLNKKTIRGTFRDTFWMIKPIARIYNKTRNHIIKSLFGEDSLIYRYLPEKSEYHIRISTGCLGNCSYCSIKDGIGPCVSKPLDECMKEFKNGLNHGFEKFVIDADETGCYGLDINSSLPELLYNITEIPGDYKISIRNLDPRWVVRYVNDLEIILKRRKIVDIESSIQSGSIRILKSMKRYSDLKKMKDAYVRLKKAYPNISLVTDYILGFPTESKEEITQTLRYIGEISFTSGTIIPFSCRIGTEAENIEPKITSQQMSRGLRYAKKYLKKIGYSVLYFPRRGFFIFWKKHYKTC